MKFKIIASLVVLATCLFVNRSSAQEFNHYQVKVKTDSLGTHKGILAQINSEGLTLDLDGKSVVIKARHIMSIRLKKNSFTTAQGLLYGTICGAAIGSMAFLGDLPDDSRLFILASVTSAGMVAGVGYGLASEILANKMTLKINKDASLFANEYHKLEKYSKAYYTDKP
ncbi:hypothetical protein H9N25_13605 [Pedobacter riviphilus]|uniref:Glycine zipper family protein n=1 Tax=Pedobacter riviphilus TaxID=2766984 RepID=A0ABX6TCI2_9SPHI|nr:hypothetical protein [Pedobacter riviphilus]QNR83012.1 hypothetical protein H9N25_13605 [Pedobacter riviphilus]